jgi:predicted RNA-binding protein associated with RNAse of E/G family
MDQILDIVISPDLSDWRWKDEDEFAEAERIGVYTSEQAQAIRAEGERVIARLNAQESPFCDGWDNWLPPDEWSIPKFPLGWEEVPI